MGTAIVWFRRDLRLEDNPALDAALRAHARVWCVYIHAPQEEAPWTPGAASNWWLHHSLAALDAQLRMRGARLHIARGPTVEVLGELARAGGVEAVYFNRLHEPALRARDAHIRKTLHALGVQAQEFNANLLIEPAGIATAQGGPYKVFTPYWRNLRARLQPRPPLPAPARIAAAKTAAGLSIPDLRLLPEIRWDGGFAAHWQPGEAGAHALLEGFVHDALDDYAQGREQPGTAGTSRLSPHLHFGEIGPQQLVWRLLGAQRPRSERGRIAAEAWLREIGWREFSHHLLHHFPHSAQRNLNAQFDALRWSEPDQVELTRWRRGRTGFPLVDAGMRQLWATGWMHNRVRMIVASFLTKNLRQHWLQGARWFWDTLVDADLANNTQGWQWTAGCGADAAPYFRVFNPVSQALRFDPDGAYVRRWVSELVDVAAPLVHEPWRDAQLLQRTGYPAPMLDLRASREAALAAYRALREPDGEGLPAAKTPGRRG